LSSPPVFYGVHISQFLYSLCSVNFHLLSLCSFFLRSLLSVLWVTVSDYPFAIVKHFLLSSIMFFQVEMMLCDRANTDYKGQFNKHAWSSTHLIHIQLQCNIWFPAHEFTLLVCYVFLTEITSQSVVEWKTY